MPKELYNEGRVVGYSTWELYVKHSLSENPNIEPATEREWLAAQLGHGSSMILKIPAEASSTSGVHYKDFRLPAGSKLCAANTIIASQFFGKCEFDTNGWATKVTDYGQTLSNTTASHPLNSSTSPEQYPTQTIREFNASEKSQILQYMKIQDGGVIQLGSWRTTSHRNPYGDLTPNLNVRPVVRLIFADKITSDFYVILTGFTSNSILSGITGFDSGSTEKIHPENGDFLGPELYPWSNKIVFTYPGIAAYYYRQGLKSTNLNLNIEANDTDFDVYFTASPLKPDVGVSMVGPLVSGGEISIGSKIGTDGNGKNYIDASQTKSSTSHIQTTTLKHSDIQAGHGIAYHKPSQPGENVIFSSIIGSDNNFLKVSQVSKPNLSFNAVNDRSSYDLASQDVGCTTILKPSLIKGSNGIRVASPESPGADTQLSVTINSSKPAYLGVSQNNGITTLKPATISNSDGLISVITELDDQGNPIIKLDINSNYLENLIENYITTSLDEFINGESGIYSVVRRFRDANGEYIPNYLTEPDHYSQTGWQIFKSYMENNNVLWDCYGKVCVTNVNTRIPHGSGPYMEGTSGDDVLLRYIALPATAARFLYANMGPGWGGSTIWNMIGAPAGSSDYWNGGYDHYPHELKCSLPFMIGTDWPLEGGQITFPVHVMFLVLSGDDDHPVYGD